ncbi:MAG TPA: helix-turn-helix domain-containing protein [Pantanalinema sp.]
MVKWLASLFRAIRTLWQAGHAGKEAATWVPDSPSQLITAWHQARNSQSLGFILNQARISKGLSLLQLQTGTGINATYLVKLEHNLINQPSIFVLVQLAEALDLDLRQLILRLDPRAYSPEDLLALERRWRLCLLAQPGNRNGILMLEAISLIWAQIGTRTSGSR